MHIKQSYSAFFLPIAVLGMYCFLYIPIIVLVLFSFNASPTPYIWGGISTRWYQELFESVEVLQALKNSLIVAFSTVVLSLVMGVLLVVYSARGRLNKLFGLFYGSLATPEIVLAAGLLSLFSFFSISLGLVTLIAGHTLIGLGYVVPMIYDRFMAIDYRLTEASLDLGATRAQTIIHVIIPLLVPTMLASGLLVFIISLDDFIIAFFCAGASVQTLPMYIFAVLRSGVSPIVNALSVMLLLVSSILVLLFSLLNVKKAEMFK